MKTLFYVPVLMVIEAEDAGEAEGKAEEICSAINQLEPKGLHGHTLVRGLETSPASDLWWDKDQVIVNDDESFAIFEKDFRDTKIQD